MSRPTAPHLHVHPISAVELDDVRRHRVDRFGNVPEPFTSTGGDQLRCCLRESRVEEKLWVIAHAPLTAQRPWREVGPVFVHADPCDGYDPARGLPAFFGHRPRVLRSYDAEQQMVYTGNRVARPADDLGDLLQTLLADSRIEEVHVRNLEAQCFLARVTR